MYKVERAIIVAAGLGNRMRPLTDSMPKPLIKVNGVRMIESVIGALKENGIEEIHIVVGYLKEQFSFLKEIYGVDIIENPFYASCNNISSLYVARQYLENAMVLDGDQIIHNKNILSPYFERSGYNAVWTDAYTQEWLMTVDKGIVKSCSRVGGERGWQLYSVSRWSAEDGRKLKAQLETEFEIKCNRQIYWDDVPMFVYPKEYSLGIFEMKREDISEIDSYDELIKVDTSYLREVYDEAQ